MVFCAVSGSFQKLAVPASASSCSIRCVLPGISRRAISPSIRDFMLFNRLTKCSIWFYEFLLRRTNVESFPLILIKETVDEVFRVEVHQIGNAFTQSNILYRQ